LTRKNVSSLLSVFVKLLMNFIHWNRLMTDFRALCAELIEAYEWCINRYMTAPSNKDALVYRARAALAAEPVGEGPSDEELERVYQGAYQPAWERKEFYGAHLDGLRAVLARWGRPAIEPVPVSERLPGPEDCDEKGRCWWFSPPACGPNTIRPCWTFDSETLEGDTHWLPHWALPVPGVEGKQ
jgi:hypothetical protein